MLLKTYFSLIAFILIIPSTTGTAEQLTQITDGLITFVVEVKSTEILEDGFNPVGMAVSDDRVYISTRGSWRSGLILILDHDLNLVANISDFNGSSFRSVGLDFTNEKLFVVDRSGQRVMIFDRDGTFISEFGKFGTEEDEFNSLTDVVVNNEFVYVADNGNSVVKIFQLNGTYVGDTDVLIPDVKQLAADNDLFYTIGGDTNPISRFEKTGQFLGSWGILESGYASEIITGQGEFNAGGPNGISAFDSHIFIGDWQTGRIQIFDKFGNFEGHYQSYQADNFQFGFIADLDVTAKHIFVMDTGLRSIVKLEYSFTGGIDSISEDAEPDYVIYESQDNGVRWSILFIVCPIILIKLYKLKQKTISFTEN